MRYGGLKITIEIGVVCAGPLSAPGMHPSSAWQRGLATLSLT